MKNSSSVQDYINLVNQPGFSDAVAANFAKMADRPANTGAQRASNAFFGGAAAGLQGYNNDERKAKLDPLVEQAKNLADIDLKLRMQAGQLENNKLEISNYALSYKPEFLSFAQALKNGDTQAATDIGKILSYGANKMLSGFKEKYGNFEFATNGKLYFEKDGQSKGYGQKEIFSSIPFEQLYGDEARDLEYLLSDYTNRKFKESDVLANLDIQQKQAEIAKTTGQTQLFGAQTRDIDSNIKMRENIEPSQYSEKTQEKIIENNLKFAEESTLKLPKYQSFEKAYNEIEKLITDNPSSAGSSKLAELRRWVEDIKGDNFARAKATLATQPLLSGLKEIFGGVISDSDLKIFISGLPSFDQNPEASILVARERAKEYREKYNRTQSQLLALEKSGYRIPYHASEIQNANKEISNDLPGNNSANMNNDQNLDPSRNEFDEIVEKFGKWK